MLWSTLYHPRGAPEDWGFPIDVHHAMECKFLALSLCLFGWRVQFESHTYTCTKFWWCTLSGFGWKFHRAFSGWPYFRHISLGGMRNSNICCLWLRLQTVSTGAKDNALKVPLLVLWRLKCPGLTYTRKFTQAHLGQVLSESATSTSLSWNFSC